MNAELLKEIQKLNPDTVTLMVTELANAALAARRDYERAKLDLSAISIPEDRKQKTLQGLVAERNRLIEEHAKRLAVIDANLAYYSQDVLSLRDKVAAAKRRAIDSQAEVKAILSLQSLNRVAMQLSEEELNLLTSEVAG